MALWVAFFRGINVGGRNIVPMKRLATALEDCHCDDVRTYIQSGNVCFRHPSRSARKVESLVGDCMESEFGFRPSVMILSKNELNAAISVLPFTDSADFPKTLHFFFLDKVPPSFSLSDFSQLATKTERFHYTKRVLYVHAPDGVGRSKFFAALNRALGSHATARNFNTVLAVRRMLDELNHC